MTITTAYDITAEPDADEFDAIAWFLGTGEDLGLPEGWLERYYATLADELAKAETPST